MSPRRRSGLDVLVDQNSSSSREEDEGEHAPEGADVTPPPAKGDEEVSFPTRSPFLFMDEN